MFQVTVSFSSLSHTFFSLFFCQIFSAWFPDVSHFFQRQLRHHEMLPSFGARADRIMQLLLVPAVGAVTSAAQMFMPGATPSL
jgi:hypothetical protein